MPFNQHLFNTTALANERCAVSAIFAFVVCAIFAEIDLHNPV
jgi:hypothetical protein